jgi:hypothetical protein
VVAFVGTPVTAADMLDRWESTVGRVHDRASALAQLEEYVRWLAAQRLGGVFEAAYDGDGVLVAKWVSNHLPARKIPIPD